MSIIYFGQIAAALLAIFSLAGMFLKYAIVKPIKLYIDQATSQIAKDANGGRSLNDVVDKVDHLKWLLQEHIKGHDTPK